MTISPKYQESGVLKIMGRLLLSIIIGISVIILIFTLRNFLIYGRASAFLVAFDAIGFSIILILSLIASCLAFWVIGANYRLIPAVCSLFYFIASLTIIIQGARDINLTQNIGNRAVFNQGDITVFGLFAFSIDQLLIGAAIYFLSRSFLRPAFLSQSNTE